MWVKMRYEINEEEAMILKMVDDICTNVVSQRAAEIDEQDEFPEDIYRLFAEQGLFSLAYGEEYGGCQVGMHCWVRMIERISKESPAVALMVLISAIGSDALVFSGSEEQKSTILPRLASGEAKICFALTEPRAGSDISSISTTAKPVDGGWKIDGAKIFITNGEVSDYFTVFAKVPRDDEMLPTCFVVPRDTSGLVIGRKEHKIGLRGSVTSQLFFEDMFVTPDMLVGEVGQGFDIAHHTLNRGRLAVAALSTGVTAACVEAAATYAQERVQFHRSISDFQAVKFMLADMEISLEASRLLLDQAADAYMDRSADMMKTASAAKAFCSEHAVDAARDAVQIFGGYGLCKDYPVERYYRDARAFTIIEGTSQVQKSLVAKAVLREYAKPEA
ncbi:acyl-CoA dehydrogenase family protein [uncultured Slackia sp.]|uniref:acyl-CoA dehydrogenase family protein n=1 Tax=uncultured Slackia sp. TaxID=665903 RepID=UPI0034CD2594